MFGKSPPVVETIDQLDAVGFDALELYLELSHLDAFDETLTACRDASLDIDVLHTPHVGADEARYIDLTFELAAALDAFVLIHSAELTLSESIALTPPAPSVPRGYENHTDDTAVDLETDVIDAEEDLVLDVAHLYRSDPDRFEAQFRQLTDHDDAIAHVHICDATADDDHRQLGAGEIPLETAVDWLTTDYDGTLTLELMPDRQPTAYDRFREIAAQV